jgi:thioredoxin reductase
MRVIAQYVTKLTANVDQILGTFWHRRSLSMRKIGQVACAKIEKLAFEYLQIGEFKRRLKRKIGEFKRQKVQIGARKSTLSVDGEIGVYFRKYQIMLNTNENTSHPGIYICFENQIHRQILGSGGFSLS